MMDATEQSRMNGIFAYAPGGIGNLGPGLDVLGCAITGAGDEVHATWTESPGVVIVDAGHPEITTDPARNACGIAASAVLDRAVGIYGSAERGVALRVHKGLPLSAGQGGSSASAVAAAVAVNQLVVMEGGDPLDRVGLLQAALAAESVVAGRHLDNVASSLMGGVICVRGIDPPDVCNVPVRMELWFALAHPAIRVRTADARAVLPASFARETLIAQMGNVASLVAALAAGDHALFGRSLVDVIAEPARAPLVPGFAAAKQAAFESGALGVSLSGSGPTTFAACASEADALAAAEAMRWSFERSGHGCTARVATIDFNGARWAPFSFLPATGELPQARDA
ncbi:MAG TPA: homoserine kinase [Gemmatimonas sp.]|nr:homoserine kinase [Gemmatimonas sp.]